MFLTFRLHGLYWGSNVSDEEMLSALNFIVKDLNVQTEFYFKHDLISRIQKAHEISRFKQIYSLKYLASLLEINLEENHIARLK